VPKLFEYFGLIVFFYSNEHEPVHVHGRYQGLESRAELVIFDGLVVEIKITDVKGKRPLEGKTLNDFKRLVELHTEDIVQKWIDYFVYNKSFKAEKITQRLK
jgi:hypothetical protein